ncbi:MAG: glycosyltransferase [Treponema sp.]|jgi:glycosyltransferase involved in cell wall biosynthesis|nr:glycosyltransferase [Treponema sp.]
MKVAIIHYWLVNMRGGEKMLEALLELYPEADIYTHVYDPSAVSETIRKHNVYTSYIQKLPFAKKLYQKYMPLMPNALKEWNLQAYGLVISSEAGPAKGVVPNPLAYHICYCHSPMRYLWDMYHEYFRNAGPVTRFFMKRLIPALRIWDLNSANMVDRFITNSSYVARRIARYYRREAAVVYGPADIQPYLALEREPGDFYLFFGQLVNYKRADLAVEACVRSGRKLVIAGSGSKKDLARLKKLAGGSALVSFKGRISDEEIRSLYSRARALIFPGIEDLGLVPIEANAAGCPVIAYREGGAVDTVRENVTGIFFDEQTADSLQEALDRFERTDLSPRGAFTRHVAQFSREAFKDRVKIIIEERRRI